MFDPVPDHGEFHDAPFDLPLKRSGHSDVGPVPAPPDPGTLLAAVGLSPHAIREILGNAAGGAAHG